MIIDDEPDMLNACAKILSTLGSSPVPVSNVELAEKLLKDDEYDLILCDLLMPGHDGMEMLEICQKIAPATPIIIFSAYGTIDRAVAAMKAGAFDFIEKPFEIDDLKIVLGKGLKQRKFFKERINLIDQLEDKYHFDNIVGKSREMRDVFQIIDDISASDVNVLITGESGTGKELIARSIHAHSNRKTNPFVPVNCGAFPENLFEAELFGYEKGAFTGASGRKKGLLEFADGGTFFLDEVCELPPGLQIKLLRTLQDQMVRKLGGNELTQVNIRIISATNQNIELALKNDVLRQDFYYRLNVITISVPPLRERKGDIPVLADHFLKKFVDNTTKKISGFTEEVINLLENYNWPGNVRELENTIERAVALSKGNIITLAELPSSILAKNDLLHNYEGKKLTTLKQKAIEEIEKKYLLFLLERYEGNITKVADAAGLTRRHVYRMINAYKIDPDIWRNK